MAKKNCARNILGVFQSVLAAAALYGILYVAVLVYERGSLPRSAADLVRKPTSKSDSDPLFDAVKGSIVPIPSGKLKVEKINVNANWFNRPESLVVPKDDYWGKRPNIDLVANLTRLVEECRGSYENIEKMPYVYDCMKFLEDGEHEYYYSPPRGERASEQPPKLAEYMNSDGHDNTLEVYPSYKPATKTSIGQCNGPIVPHHVYWTGPSTWRVELFVKSHLYTQNLPCVRLFIWLDGDRDPDAVEKMLTSDPLFARFLPLVERGDIVLKTWRFPSRIPLPAGDNTDGVGYYKSPGKPNSKNETIVGDGLIRDGNNQEWLVLTEKQMTFLPVAVSDAVRFIVLHIYGGAYFDMDIVMLRDMRPFVIGEQHSFAERWGGHANPGDYNTAIMSLSANSSLSSYLLRGAVRMGLNFHPRIVGVMAVKDKRNHEFHMLETAAFDSLWTDFDHDRLGKCTIPCLHDYTQVFQNSNAPLFDEWNDYDGPQLLETAPAPRGHLWENRGEAEKPVSMRESKAVKAVTYDRDELTRAEYKIEEDNYPPTNRTLQNFFKGAWTYHVHNQWLKNPEPSSWLNVVQRAHDGFFSSDRKNPYGERWDGPSIAPYEVSWEYT